MTIKINGLTAKAKASHPHNHKHNNARCGAKIVLLFQFQYYSLQNPFPSLPNSHSQTSFPLLSNSSLPFPFSLQTLSSPPHFPFLKHQSTTTKTEPEPEPGRRGIRRWGYRRRRARGRSQKRCSRVLYLLIPPVNNRWVFRFWIWIWISIQFLLYSIKSSGFRGRAQCSDPTRSKAEQA